MRAGPCGIDARWFCRHLEPVSPKRLGSTSHQVKGGAEIGVGAHHVADAPAIFHQGNEMPALDAVVCGKNLRTLELCQANPEVLRGFE